LPDDRLSAVDEDRPARTESSGLGELPLRRASGVIHVGTQTTAAELGDERQNADSITFQFAHEEHVDVRRLGAIRPDREQEPLDARAEPDARVGGPPISSMSPS